MMRFLKLLNAKRILLVIGIAVVALLVQPDHRPGGQALPVVRLISVEPSSQITEGNTLRINLGINPPVSAGDPGLTGGRLLGGIIVTDSRGGSSDVDLIAFAFWPGDTTDVVTYTVQVVDDDGAVNTNRTVRIAINSVFDEYSVGSPSETTVRVLDRDSTGPPPPPPPLPPPPPPPEDTPTPVPPPEDTPTPVPPPEDTPTPVPPPEDTPTPVPPPEDTPTPVPPPEDTPTPVPPPEDTPTPVPPPPTPTPTLVPLPTNTPTPTPTAEPTPSPLAATASSSGTAPVPQLVQPELDQPSAPVISMAIPRVRDALGGIASSPRRRTTLIIIQGLASVFAAAVFARLILRRE